MCSQRARTKRSGRLAVHVVPAGITGVGVLRQLLTLDPLLVNATAQRRGTTPLLLVGPPPPPYGHISESRRAAAPQPRRASRGVQDVVAVS